MIPIFTECPDCAGRGQITFCHANDPYADVYDCETCDGTGETVTGCDYRLDRPGAPRCTEAATEWFDGSYFCAEHTAVERADSFGETVRG